MLREIKIRRRKMGKKITYIILFALLASFIYVGFNIEENRDLGDASQIVLNETISKPLTL